MKKMSIEKSHKIFCFPFSTPLREVSAAVRGRSEPVFVLARGEVIGAIHDYERFVEEHSFFDSPFGVGTLLKNVANLSLLVDDSVRLVRKIRDGNRTRIDILSRSRKLIAWVWTDRYVHDDRPSELYLAPNYDTLSLNSSPMAA